MGTVGRTSEKRGRRVSENKSSPKEHTSDSDREGQENMHTGTYVHSQIEHSWAGEGRLVLVSERHAEKEIHAV